MLGPEINTLILTNVIQNEKPVIPLDALGSSIIITMSIKLVTIKGSRHDGSGSITLVSAQRGTACDHNHRVRIIRTGGGDPQRFL